MSTLRIHKPFAQRYSKARLAAREERMYRRGIRYELYCEKQFDERLVKLYGPVVRTGSNG